MKFHLRKREDMFGKKTIPSRYFFPQQISVMVGKGSPYVRLLLLVYKMLNSTLCVLHTHTQTLFKMFFKLHKMLQNCVREGWVPVLQHEAHDASK